MRAAIELIHFIFQRRRLFYHEGLFGLAFSVDGTLYGSTGGSGSQPKSLFTIAPNTGASTLVGYIGRAAYDIAFDRTTDVLYAFGDTMGGGAVNRSTPLTLKMLLLRLLVLQTF